MDEREIKVRLIEAASSLPGVRVGTDYHEQARRVVECVKLWYNESMGVEKAPRRGPPHRKQG